MNGYIRTTSITGQSNALMMIAPRCPVNASQGGMNNLWNCPGTPYSPRLCHGIGPGTDGGLRRKLFLRGPLARQRHLGTGQRPQRPCAVGESDSWAKRLRHDHHDVWLPPPARPPEAAGRAGATRRRRIDTKLLTELAQTSDSPPRQAGWGLVLDCVRF